MSRIDMLIEQLCPDGVEYRNLEEVITNLRTGLNPRKNFQLNTPDASNYYVTVRELSGRSLAITDKTDRVNDEGLQLINNRSRLREGDVLLSGTGTIGRTAYIDTTPTDWGIKEGVYAITVNHDLLQPLFLIHYLHSNAATSWMASAAEGGTVVSISMAKLKKLRIPIPPMELQQEIVRVLDSFAELEAELEARHRQYDYYRDRLFADCDSIEWVGLLDLAKDCDRARKPIKQEDRIPGDTPYYGASGIVDHVDGFTHEGDYLLVSEDGANLVARTYPIAFQIHGRNWVNNHAHVLQIDNEQVRKLVEIYLNSISLEPYISKGAQPKLTKKKLGDIKVPVPSEADLVRIVGILEQFDVLTTDISQGLPAEIEARRRQYAYYRDKLLTFKEKVA